MENRKSRENIDRFMEEQRKRIEELEQEKAALKEALIAAEEANKAKSRFLSNMSHDIRTPMNAIMGMTSIGLSHIDEKARVHDCLGKIQTAASHLMSLVNDVLDMSRIDSDRLTLNEEPFSLADLIHDISVIVRPQAAQKNQELKIEIGRIEEENIIGDPLHLRQVLVNIIGNAVKYTQDGGEISVRFAQRYAKADPPEEKEAEDVEAAPETAGSMEAGMVWLDFCCEDNGIGMSPEFLQKIFIPFERVHSEATSKIEGTGLGMSIVKNLVERMNGEILVESEEGAGSCFTVHLPMATAPQETTALHLPTGAAVLIAENRKERAGQMARYLREAGLTSVHQEKGAQAVTWLTQAQYEGHMPCAMLLGEELSDMQPLHLASHVRQLAGRDFPILLVSEADWVQLEYRATRAGVNGFVPSPLFKSRLLGTLAELLGGMGSDDNSVKQELDYSDRRILLVEDIELNQEIAVELLSVTGVQVELADDGSQAVKKFSDAPEGYYDLIFMDIHMPVMDGYEATRQIRGMERADAAAVWIVAMTADAFVEDVRQAKEAGMNEHISKPVEPGRLQEILYRQFSG